MVAPEPQAAPAPVTVAFTVRDGPSLQEIPAAGWSARLEVPPEPGGAVREPARARPVGTGTEGDGLRAVAGPVPEGEYVVIIEAPGYQTLVRRAVFRAGLNNRIDAALDPLPPAAAGPESADGTGRDPGDG